MDIKYIKGNATNPAGEGNKLIVHICNDTGGWGKRVCNGNFKALERTRTKIPGVV